MVIDFPFLQRFTGRSPNRGDIRDMICWDVHRMHIPEFELSDFVRGVDFGDDIHTLYKDGEHWAYYAGSVKGVRNPAPASADDLLFVFRSLSCTVDTTRFFDEGRIRRQTSRTMSEPLAAKWVESTQRDRNVTRLEEYVFNNVATIDGHLAVRVGEPSMRLVTSEPDDNGVCRLQLHRDMLTPFQTPHHPGIHVATTDIPEIISQALLKVEHHPGIDEFKVMLEEEVLDRIVCHVASSDDMHERTIDSLATAAAEKRLKGYSRNSANEHFDTLLRFRNLEYAERTADTYESAMDALLHLYGNTTKPAHILVEMAAERWHNRPIAFDNPLPGQRHP